MPLQASRASVALYTHLDVDGEHLAEIAERTIRWTRRWLGEEPAGGAPMSLVLCGDPDELGRVTRELSLADSADTRVRAGGGYFHEGRTIAVVVDGTRNLDWLIAHESWHVVFRDLVRVHPVALNEGLGEVLPSWILFSDAEGPEDARATYASYETYLANYEDWRTPPTAQQLIQMTVEDFHRDRWESFSFAWSLVRFLIEYDDPEVRGRMPTFLRRLGQGETPWEDFYAVYDGARVQELWQESWAASRAQGE